MFEFMLVFVNVNCLPLTTTMRLLYIIFERVKLNEKKNINNEKVCTVEKNDNVIIVDYFIKIT